VKIAAAIVIGMLLGGAAVWLSYNRPVAKSSSIAAAATSPLLPVIAAAEGRVEGRTQNIEVEASANGVVQSLIVREGQKVAKDQIIGQIACENLDSEVRALEASRESANQARVRLLRGSRDEERRVAEQGVAAAQAIVDHAQRENDRMQFLASKDDVSQQTAENAKRDLATAEAAIRSALEKQKLVNAGPLPEEVSKADADVATVDERLQATVAQRDKCVIRAPISGTVTRVNMRVGEAFSTVVPRPIVTMADLSERRIRAEVDERDLSKIHVNQRVRVTAEGLQRPFTGKVTWTAVLMGRRTAMSTDPAERADRDIRETLITPDRGAEHLPIGLRVVVEFLRD